jgi:murein DD-endopeptidase MepM/ murein hydrolase activator NlpD
VTAAPAGSRRSKWYDGLMLPHPRRALLLGALAAFAIAPTARAALPAPTPADDPAPFAASRAAIRYWPVITDYHRALQVSALFDDGGADGERLRRFNAPRPAAREDNPTRRHVGVDLFASAGDTVIAVEDGEIIAFYPFLRARTGEMSWALLVAHDGYVATYGEVRDDALTAKGLALGDRVRAAQHIATISDTRQLHFETYVPGTRRNASWRHGAPRPASVLDPTALLLDLAANGRRIRPGEPGS